MRDLPYKVRLLGFASGPALLGLAVLLAQWTHALVPHGELYIFLAAVAVTGWISGRGPAVFAAFLASIVLYSFFLPPLHTAGISLEASSYVLPFWLAALAAAWMSSALHKANRSVAEMSQCDEKLRRLLAHLPDVPWTTDQTGRLIFISPNIEQVTGYSAEFTRAEGLKLLEERTHPEDYDRVRSELSDLLSGRKPFDVEFRFQRKDGTWIWLHNRAIGTYVVNGTVYADGVVTDVSLRKQAELDLQSKTAFLEALLNSSMDGVLARDASGRCIFQNERLAEMHRFPTEFLRDLSDQAMLEHTLRQVKDPSSFLAQIQLFKDHSEETARDEMEFNNGTILEQYSAPVVDARGNFYGRIWTYRDVTERSRYALDLKAKKAFLEAQVNSTIDGILVVDAEGRRILQNQRMTEIFRIPSEILVDADDSAMLEYVLTLMKDPESFLARVEYLYNHANETSRDQIELIDGTFLDRYSAPVVDKAGNYYGRIWSFRDVTQRKMDEDALRQLSAAVEQSPASIVITDPLGNITYVNRKFSDCTGYSFDEVMGKPFDYLNSVRASTETNQELWDIVLSGKEWRGEFRSRKKSGEIFWESAAITPIVDQAGHIIRILAVKEDTTERRRLESELRQAQKLEGIGQLAAGIAHEINTPAQFVTDNLTFLKESWTTISKLVELYRAAILEYMPKASPATAAGLAEAERTGDLEFIAEEVPRAIAQSLDGARRVASIVQAMKEFSHPDSAEKTEADLNKGVSSTLTVARNEWRPVAEMVTDFDDALPPMVCYPGEVNQVILNLVVNAAHSIKERVKDGEKGKITVCTRLRGRFAEIAVTDTGMGIPEEIQNRVYEPFFTTKEVGKGTGQGLAFAHSVIVKKHQGKLWFETEPGRGTTFFIQLPIVQEGVEMEKQG
jgi:PAS domain S-box-containing protein